MKFRGKRKPQHYDADCGIALPWKPEHALELNALLDPLPMLLLQPVVDVAWHKKEMIRQPVTQRTRPTSFSSAPAS
jgi:hypothetical protein